MAELNIRPIGESSYYTYYVVYHYDCRSLLQASQVIYVHLLLKIYYKEHK